MAILKRLLIWLAECSIEAMLTGVLLLILAHVEFRGEHLGADRPAHDLLALTVMVAVMFFSTGYLMTTIVARLVLRPERRLFYPIVASALYAIHFEILNIAAGGFGERLDQLVIPMVGACIAFACTLGGNQVLLNWKRASALVAEV